MNVTVELESNDARFLYEQLMRHVETMQNELVHTDKRELQRAIALDLARLQRIAGKLGGTLQQQLSA
jgi:hypothetical protein